MMDSNYPRAEEHFAIASKKVKPLEYLLIGVIIVILVAVFFPASSSGGSSRRSAELSNVKQIGLGIAMYSNDFDDRLPVRQTWMDSTLTYTKNKTFYHALEIPNPSPTKYGIAFRTKLSTQKLPSDPASEQTAMVFDSTLLDRNANSELWSLPNPPRHSGRTNVVAFADGHAKSVTQEASQNLK